MKNRTRTARVLLLAILVLGGCSVTGEQPVMVRQHGDAELSCEELEQALDRIVAEISNRLVQGGPGAGATRPGITDLFLLEPARYRQLDAGDQAAVDALVQRYNHLVGLGREKDCECERRWLPEFR
jgi:hypothetical protein